MEKQALVPLEGRVEGHNSYVHIPRIFIYNTFEGEDTDLGSRNRGKFLPLCSSHSSGGEREIKSEYTVCQVVIVLRGIRKQ